MFFSHLFFFACFFIRILFSILFEGIILCSFFHFFPPSFVSEKRVSQENRIMFSFLKLTIYKNPSHGTSNFFKWFLDPFPRVRILDPNSLKNRISFRKCSFTTTGIFFCFSLQFIWFCFVTFLFCCLIIFKGSFHFTRQSRVFRKKEKKIFK